MLIWWKKKKKTIHIINLIVPRPKVLTTIIRYQTIYYLISSKFNKNDDFPRSKSYIPNKQLNEQKIIDLFNQQKDQVIKSHNQSFLTT